MTYPFVVERVWVSGLRDELLVSGIDYATNAAVVEEMDDGGRPLEDPPLQTLLALREIEAAQAHRSNLEAARCILRSSERHFYRSRETIWHMREMLRATFDCIHQTQALIAESDKLIARSLSLGCDNAQQDSVSEHDGAGSRCGVYRT